MHLEDLCRHAPVFPFQTHCAVKLNVLFPHVCSVSRNTRSATTFYDWSFIKYCNDLSGSEPFDCESQHRKTTATNRELHVLMIRVDTFLSS